MKHEDTYDLNGFSEETLKKLERSKMEMHVPDDYFEKKAILLESAMIRSFDVPEDYFENQQSQLSEKLMQASDGRTRLRSIRLWVSLAAAAMMAGVVFLLIPGKRENPSFSEQLYQCNLEFEDLEQVDFDEEVYDEFVVMDTIAPDTAAEKKIPASVNDFKPSKGQSVISWDDIDASDIEEYLKDEETLEIIDEL
ncbi:MAG: hypothetical protein ACKO7B_17720 [Flavobacteriales bacterium]